MLLFSLECSAAAASASLYREGKLLGEEFLNVPQTHSVTLLPMAKSLLEHTGISPAQIDYYAVSRGPGSFTGLRIGIAAIKGLAFPDNTPCIGVSTPEAIAYGLLGFEGIVIPMMDARCGQVYTALFQGKDGCLPRLS
uniref:tRNA (adenosine(37)-N6)-threonylcarbamoyltransferase complex dimerization subunit type 1 TsaB n=1 Tax=Angelakisella sp. TaxID=1935177 RepID=UPI003FEDF72F